VAPAAQPPPARTQKKAVTEKFLDASLDYCADVLTPLHPSFIKQRREAEGGRTPVLQTLFALQGNAEPRLELLRVRTEFLCQPYLDLPLELRAELWPQDRGDVEMVVSFRHECVNEATAIELGKLYSERLTHRA
jgi:hypothetical protein